MKQMPLEKRGISTSRLAFGCMGIGGGWNHNALTKQDYIQAEKAIDAALSIGITMFDHADIYTFGKAETIFGQIFKNRPDLRGQMILQSKCGIILEADGQPQQFNFSKEHILKAIDDSLQRLEIDYLDTYLLHRPDPLMEPEEIAEALFAIKAAGKVRHFGVSNMTSAQIKFIQSALPEPLVINQLEMSLARLDWLEQGITVNQKVGASINFADGIMEYCQTENIQIQAWGPLAQGIFSGKAPTDKSTPAQIQTAELVQKMAEQKNTTAEAIVLGWLMRHPAMIQPVIGTSNVERVLACKDAVEQSELMTREEWYTLFQTSRGNFNS